MFFGITHLQVSQIHLALVGTIQWLSLPPSHPNEDPHHQPLFFLLKFLLFEIIHFKDYAF